MCGDRNDAGYFLSLIFFGSQASFFDLTTAPQSSQMNLPGFGLVFDLPFLQSTRQSPSVAHPLSEIRNQPAEPSIFPIGTITQHRECSCPHP